jgi:thioredoxin 1
MRRVLTIFLFGMFFVGCSHQGSTTVLKISPTAGPNISIEEADSSRVIQGNYRVFHEADYTEARQGNKTIVLFFYANWCPTCRVQEPIVKGVFENLNDDQIVGFRVNYNDSDTSSEEKKIAAEFGITYQHTFVVLDNKGKVVKKFNGEWSQVDMEEFLKGIN